MAWTKGNENLVEGTLAQRLSKARMWHSLFQHHDGITGTARDEVVIDYAKKMIMALNNSAHVLQQSVAHLLKTPQESAVDVDAVYMSLDESRFEMNFSIFLKVVYFYSHYFEYIKAFVVFNLGCAIPVQGINMY